MLSTVGGCWQHKAERSLVALGRPTVGIGVVISNGLAITTASTVVGATGGDRSTVVATAADDYRWHGAMARVLAVENDIAILGSGGWLEADAHEALDQLLHERAAVDVAALPRAIETTLCVPTPNGGWLRLPALACGDRTLIIRAAPLAGCEVVFALLDGVPAFTEPGQLAGFVRVVRSPRSGQSVLAIVRADAALATLSRVPHGVRGEP